MAIKINNKDIKFSHIVFGLVDLLEEFIRHDIEKG